MIKDKIIIALCSDERGADFMQVAIKSIFINNKDEDVELHLITDGFSGKTINGLNRLEKKFNRNIAIHNIDVSEFDNIPGAGDGFAVPKGTLFRFLIPDLLRDVHKVLYLDTDVVVEGNLRDLWSTDLTNYTVAGVVDRGYLSNINSKEHIIDYLGFHEDEYVNAGVLLMNLDYFRTNKVSDLCLKWLVDNPEKALFCDQTALNTILRGKILYLPDKYNVNHTLYTSVPGTDTVAHNPILDEARSNPVIVHFTGWHKPWTKTGLDCYPANAKRFHKYRKMRPCTSVKPNMIYPNCLRRRFYHFLYKMGMMKRIPLFFEGIYGLDPRVK